MNYSHSSFLDDGLFIGIMTKQLIRRLYDQGDISTQQVHQFYNAVRCFYSRAAEYALANLPLHDEVLQNAVFVNFAGRATATISQIEYFISRYNNNLLV